MLGLVGRDAGERLLERVVRNASTAPRYAPRNVVSSLTPSFAIAAREANAPLGYEKSKSSATAGVWPAPERIAGDRLVVLLAR